MEKFEKKISFVIPCYHSENTIEAVVDDICKEFSTVSDTSTEKRMNIDYFQELGRREGDTTTMGGSKDVSNSHQ